MATTGSVRLVVMASACALGACVEEDTQWIADEPTALIAVGDHLAWREADGGIVVARTDGSSMSSFRPATLAACDGELHATSAGIYWADCDLMIVRADFDGREVVPLGFSVGSSRFAVDDTTIYGGIGPLRAYPLDGGPADSLTTEPIVVSSLAFDEHGALYIGAGTGGLESTLTGGIYDVATQRRIIPWNTDIPISLAVGESTIAWSGREEAFRANLDGTGITTIGRGVRSGLQIREGRIWWVTIDDDLVSTALDGSDLRTHYLGTTWLVGPAFVDGRAYLLESGGRRINQSVISESPGYRLIAIDYASDH
jgi:hypothetical protein